MSYLARHDHPEDDALLRDVAAVSTSFGSYVLSNGVHTSVYFDRFLMQCEPAILRRLAVRIADHVPERARRLVGAEPGSVPLATAVSLETGIPMLVLRHAGRAGAVQATVEGEASPGDAAVLVTDIVASGRHAASLVGDLIRRGLDVVAVLAVIDREAGAADELARLGLTMTALFTENDLRHVLRAVS